jgi:hypothetical protein
MPEIDIEEGDDFVCPNCGCEITLKHFGPTTRDNELRVFRCTCGTDMEFEHPRGEQFAGVPML